MRVSRVDIFPITMRLSVPVPMANGTIDHTDNVLVRLLTDDGLVGWGEGVEAPALTHQSQRQLMEDLEALTPLVIGADPDEIEMTWGRLMSALPWASTAVGAIDIALHDLAGKARGVPIHELIGGAMRDRIPALTLVGSGDPALDAEALTAKWERGYRWFKVKLGMAPPQSELETMARAVELCDGVGVVSGDANEAWDEEQASAFLQGLDRGVRFIEQPVSREDRPGLLRLAATSPVSICADESAGSLEDVAGFVGSGIGGVSLKLIKHGGITGVMRGASICEAGGLAVNLAGKVIESSISASANLHCAAAMQALDYGCSPAHLGVVGDVTGSAPRLVDGAFEVPSGPGLGIDVDEAMLKRMIS